MNMQLQQMRELLSARFDRTELQSLYLDLGVDSEEARSESKSELVRYLLEYCQRHERLPELLARCKVLRPTLEWPNTLQVDTRGFTTPSFLLPKVRSFKVVILGGLRGILAGAIAGVVLGIILATQWSGNSSLESSLFAIAVTATLSMGVMALIGLPLGMFLGFVDQNGNRASQQVGAGALGGLLIGMVFATALKSIPLVGFGLLFGVVVAVTTWATRNLFWKSSFGAKQPEEVIKTSTQELLSGVAWACLAGAIMGALLGSLAGLFIELTVSERSLLPSTPQPTSRLLAAMGAITGAIFLISHKIIGRQLVPPKTEIPNTRASLIAVFSVLSLVVFTIGLRPIAHGLLVERQTRPFVTREYVGRVVDSLDRPVSNATIRVVLENIPIETFSNQDGVYRFQVTAVDEWMSGTIYVDKPSYERYSRPLMLDPNTTTIRDITVVRAPLFEGTTIFTTLTPPPDG